MSWNSKVALFFFLAVAVVYSSAALAENEDGAGGLVMNYYKDSCPQAEEIIKEQVQLLYKRHKNTAFSWLRNIFHDCFVEVSNHLFSIFFLASFNKIIFASWIISHATHLYSSIRRGGCSRRRRPTGASG